MELIAYYRVSSQAQLLGYGLDAQRENVERWVTANGHSVIATCRDEGVTGTTADRPGLTDALAQLEDGRADGLVIASLDRLAREMHVQEAILSKIWSTGASVYMPGQGEILRDDPGLLHG